MALLFGAATAHADQFDTLNYTASAGATYDNNIFRLPSWEDPKLFIGNPDESDWIRQLSLGVNADKKYSNQEILFNATITNYKFNTFSFLDYDNTVYNAAWNWTLGSKLSGTLNDNRSQTLNTFTDIHVYARNLTTVDRRVLNADWWFQSDWHLLLGVSDGRTTSTASVINNQSYTNKSGEWGLKYAPDDKVTISLVSRLIKGNGININPDYVNQVDTSYTERQEELKASWQVTGKSALSGNLMSINHKYPIFFRRDYSGTQGGVNYAWSISGKTLLNVSANRSISAWIDTLNSYSSSYFIADTVSISPSWQIGPKTNLLLSASRGRTDYLGAIYLGAIVPNPIARHDVNRSEMLEIDWTPQRSVKVAASVQHSGRDTNYMSYQYSDTSASVSLILSF